MSELKIIMDGNEIGRVEMAEQKAEEKPKRPRLWELIQDLLENVSEGLLHSLEDGDKKEPPPIELFYTICEKSGVHITCLEFPFTFSPTEKDVEEWEKEADADQETFDSRLCHVLRYITAPNLRHLRVVVRQELGGRKFMLSRRSRDGAGGDFRYFPNKVR